MDEMPSAQFRKVYAKLKEPVLVTVNGHVIGEWVPGGEVYIHPAVEEVHILEGVALNAKSIEHMQRRSAEFRPVPKPTRKGK
jgi:hypothetical protein